MRVESLQTSVSGLIVSVQEIPRDYNHKGFCVQKIIRFEEYLVHAYAATCGAFQKDGDWKGDKLELIGSEPLAENI